MSKCADLLCGSFVHSLIPSLSSSPAIKIKSHSWYICLCFFAFLDFQHFREIQYWQRKCEKAQRTPASRSLGDTRTVALKVEA